MAKNSCCDKVGILRERIEATSQVFEELKLFLESLEDQDDFTLRYLIKKMDDVEYENDKQLPFRFGCEHERKK